MRPRAYIDPKLVEEIVTELKEVFGPGTPLRDIVQFFEPAAKGG